MKKIVSLIVMIVLVLSLTGCGTKKTTKTPANALATSFEEIIKNEKDVLTVAQKLSQDGVLKTKMMVEEKTTDDFLTGFDEEITNYKKAAVIQPMIGSIPFIAYVFETDSPKDLEDELKTKSNPRWNICVEADETVIKVVDNYVFFVMSPKSFEE